MATKQEVIERIENISEPNISKKETALEMLNKHPDIFDLLVNVKDKEDASLFGKNAIVNILVKYKDTIDNSPEFVKAMLSDAQAIENIANARKFQKPSIAFMQTLQNPPISVKRLFPSIFGRGLELEMQELGREIKIDRGERLKTFEEYFDLPIDERGEVILGGFGYCVESKYDTPEKIEEAFLEKKPKKGTEEWVRFLSAYEYEKYLQEYANKIAEDHPEQNREEITRRCRCLGGNIDDSVYENSELSDDYRAQVEKDAVTKVSDKEQLYTLEEYCKQTGYDRTGKSKHYQNSVMDRRVIKLAKQIIEMRWQEHPRHHKELDTSGFIGFCASELAYGYSIYMEKYMEKHIEEEKERYPNRGGIWRAMLEDCLFEGLGEDMSFIPYRESRSLESQREINMYLFEMSSNPCYKEKAQKAALTKILNKGKKYTFEEYCEEHKQYRNEALNQKLVIAAKKMYKEFGDIKTLFERAKGGFTGDYYTGRLWGLNYPLGPYPTEEQIKEAEKEAALQKVVGNVYGYEPSADRYERAVDLIHGYMVYEQEYENSPLRRSMGQMMEEARKRIHEETVSEEKTETKVSPTIKSVQSPQEVTTPETNISDYDDFDDDDDVEYRKDDYEVVYDRNIVSPSKKTETARERLEQIYGGLVRIKKQRT